MRVRFSIRGLMAVVAVVAAASWVAARLMPARRAASRIR